MTDNIIMKIYKFLYVYFLFYSVSAYPQSISPDYIDEYIKGYEFVTDEHILNSPEKYNYLDCKTNSDDYESSSWADSYFSRAIEFFEDKTFRYLFKIKKEDAEGAYNSFNLITYSPANSPPSTSSEFSYFSRDSFMFQWETDIVSGYYTDDEITISMGNSRRLNTRANYYFTVTINRETLEIRDTLDKNKDWDFLRPTKVTWIGKCGILTPSEFLNAVKQERQSITNLLEKLNTLKDESQNALDVRNKI